ncbi:unnamed protein product [Brassica rapa]|uniref:Uncharacterized protein n=1 Tax=Brassica campestris TaxID=3711 RepID=A0A8D9GRV5_BRACM|nr:unnamed protein product [Brassica rapa]
MIQSSVNAHWLNTFRLNVLCYWAKLGELGVGLSEINANNDKLHHFHYELVEFKLLLDKAGDLFASARSHTARGSFAAESTKS